MIHLSGPLQIRGIVTTDKFWILAVQLRFFTVQLQHVY